MKTFDFSLQPGDFVLFQHESDLGRIIQRVTGSWASHAAFCTVAPDGLIEAADLDGVRQTKIEDYTTDHTFIRIQVRREPLLSVPDAVVKALSMNGKPYGTFDLFKIYGYRMGWCDLDRATLDGEDKIICSELVARALAAGGVDVRKQFGVQSFGMVTPAMLAETTIPVVYDYTREESHEAVHAVPAVAPDPPADH
jgi:hypothetical protein